MKSVKEEILAKVKERLDDNQDDCIYVAKNKYVRRRGVNHHIKPIVFEYYHGESANGRYIGATCGNKLCANPNHIYLMNPEPQVKDDEVYDVFLHEHDDYISGNECFTIPQGTEVTHKGRVYNLKKVVFERMGNTLGKGFKVSSICGNEDCLCLEHMVRVPSNLNAKFSREKAELIKELAVWYGDDKVGFNGLFKSVLKYSHERGYGGVSADFVYKVLRDKVYTDVKVEGWDKCPIKKRYK